MTPRLLRRMAWAGAFSLVVMAGTAPAKAPHYLGLATIEAGQWQLRENGDANEQTICVADPKILLQLGHPGERCAHAVLSDTAAQTQVHYNCRGNGQGQTIVSVETPRLIRVQTQGITHGAPFDHDYEGRRLGDCPTGAR